LREKLKPEGTKPFSCELTRVPKIGILGGTFNPVHYAHLFIAQSALEAFGLDKVFLVPNSIPPHKQVDSATPSAFSRYQMVKLAVAGNPALEALDLEINRGEISYTVDTVKSLKALDPQTRLFYLAGLDSLLYYRWKGMEELLENLTGFILVNRPGADFAAFENWKQNCGLAGVDKFMPLNIPEVFLSATLIRKRLQQGLTVKYLLPEKVEEYIKQNLLYQNQGVRK